MRNAVGLKWIDGALWATNQGSDHLGTARPDETMYSLTDDADYGWPYCHSANGRIFADPKIKRRTACRNVTTPKLYFPARSSALGFDFFGADADEEFRDSFLVSLHGSTFKAIGRGYKIVAAKKVRDVRDVITGFLQRGRVVGRPCDIYKLGPDSFLFTDDYAGVIYLVRKKP